MKRRNVYVLLIAFSIKAFCFAQTEVSLNGQWEIIFDETNEGRAANWHKDSIFQAHPEKREIKVPTSWELIQQNYEGVGFYRHELFRSRGLLVGIRYGPRAIR